MSCCTQSISVHVYTGLLPMMSLPMTVICFFAIKKTSVAYGILCNKQSRDVKQRKCVLNKVNLNNMYVQLI